MGVRVCVYACWVKMEMAWNDFWQATFSPSNSLFLFSIWKPHSIFTENKMFVTTKRRGEGECRQRHTFTHVAWNHHQKNMMKEVGKSYCCIIPLPFSLATLLKSTNINWFAVVYVSENNVYFRFVHFYASFCFVFRNAMNKILRTMPIMFLQMQMLIS